MYLLETMKKAIETVTGVGKPSARAMRDAVHARTAHETMFRDDGSIPNNPNLPFIHYRNAVALPDSGDTAATFEGCSSATAGEIPGATVFTITCIIIRTLTKCSALRVERPACVSAAITARY